MKFKFIIIHTLFLLFSLSIYAQSQFLNQDTYKNRISFSTGLNPSFNYNLRYERLIKVNGYPHQMAFTGEFTSTFYRGLGENSMYKVGGRALLFESQNFQGSFQTGVSYGLLGTKLYQGQKWEWNNRLEIGHYGKKARVAALLAYNQNMGLKLEHTDFYRENIYPDAQDGWYKGVGSFFDFGASGGVLIREKFDLGLEIKTSFTSGGYMLNIIPIQFLVELGWRL